MLHHFSSFGHQAQLFLNLIVCFFGFSSLGHHPQSSLSFFFNPLVSHLLATILCYLCSFSFPSLGHHPRFCVNLIVCSFGFLSLGDYPWFYFSLFFLHLVSHHWGTILGSILIYSLFFQFFIIWTPSYSISVSSLLLLFLILKAPS